MTMHARSSQPSRRPRALLIALALLTLLALLIGLFPPPDGAQAQGVPGFRVRITYSPPGSSASSPGNGWVAAERISFSGCIDRGNFGDCFGQTESTTGLYEHRPVRRSAGRSYDPARPPAPSPIFSGLDRQPCIAGGVFQFWPEGKWRFGGRWTRTVSYGQLEYSGSTVILPVTVSWSQVGTHAWAFYPDDTCPTTPIVTRTPTPPGGGPPTATPPGGGPPPTPPRVPVTPTPPPTPTAPPTESPCYESPIPPMPLVLYEGRIPFDGSNINPPFTGYAGRYTGADPSRYYQGDTRDARFVDERLPSSLMPERTLWVQVQPNRIVQATFELLNASFRPPGYSVGWGAFDESRLQLGRGLMIVLQDLGNDRRPGGGDDTLLAFIAAGDSSMAMNGQPPQRLQVAGSVNDVYPRTPIEGRPSGFQAFLRPGVLADYTAPVFTWAGRGFDAAPHSPSRWPVPVTYGPDGRITVWDRSWFWPPRGVDPSNLSLRFATEPNRVYRMLAVISAPVCQESYHAVSALVFHTLGDADMAIEKSAPAEAVRGEQIAYSLTARNIGTTAAQDVVVVDTLPEGVTFESADPPPSSVNGRTLTWNLGAVDAGAARSIALTVNVPASAPDALTNVGEVRASNDGNAANNRAEATTALVRTNVAVRMTATRMVRPGDEFTVTITYRNTSGTTARNARLTYNRPFGAALLSSSRAPSAADGSGMVWQLGDLGAGAEGTITLRLRALRENEAATLPAAMGHVAVIAAAQDADPQDNEARAVTALLVMPRPNGDLRMRIYSEFDRMQQVYRTDGTAFAWPIGETLYFLPEVTLQPPPIMAPPAYAARQRVVAWSFVGSGPLTLSGTGCKARETPPAAETEHADLSRMRGCAYRYRETAGPTEMLGQGRLYWAPFAPASLAAATYGIWPLPASPTNLRIQYAVLTELVETGWYDLDGDGRDDSVLDRRTDVLNGTYTVTLVAPRDMR